MCGIVGIATVKQPVDPVLLATMRDTMAHRGPDDRGLYCSADGCVGLAHRRLSIIDLSPLGHQPMTDPSGELVVCFNGEIYNFQDLRRELEAHGRRFRSTSDTEVILEAYRVWGADCLSRLNGMFSFALYDAGKRMVLAARDRAGEKPFFYTHQGGRLAFASELKALLADPVMSRRLDLRSLEEYLAYGYVGGDRCMLQGVCKLPPGHAMTYHLDSDRLHLWRYWSLPQDQASPAPAPRGEPAEELVEELERLLEDSVRMRLVADVPVGILLSGGLDSSLVTALAARVSARPVKTFTISFPGHGRFDEGPYARLVASHFGTEHVEMQAEPATVDLLPDLARQFDEPMADSSMVPTYLVSRLVRREATVALGGDGGDELFGGYPHYAWVQRLQRCRRLIPHPVRQMIGACAARLPVGVRGRNHAIALAGDGSWGLAHVNLHFDRTSRRRLLAGAWSADLEAEVPERRRADQCDPRESLLRQACRMDFQNYLVDDILVKVDRASMLTSLEVRAPYLDHRLIEFAFSRVGDALRATCNECKILPRRLARKLLPARLDLHRKQGFTLPLQAWFKGPWGEFMAQVLAESDSRLFDRREVQGLLALQRKGLANSQRLFTLVLFELWRRQYGVST